MLTQNEVFVDKFEKPYRGKLLTIVHCEGALKSFEKVICTVSPPTKRTKMTNDIIMQIRKLANGDRLSNENFPQEGFLPPNANGVKDHFWAFKKIPIRGYGWYSRNLPDTFFVSHYVHKKKDKLDSNDTTKVHNNWRKYELE